MHCAIAAIDPEPGDEIITTSITDMGALTPILYQGAIPVFADVDPVTLNVTAETIERAFSPRTQAIIVTHLFGNPAELGKIMALADARGIPVIEDCAQAFLASEGGKRSARSAPSAASACSRASTSRPAKAASSPPTATTSRAGCSCSSTRRWGYGDPKPDHYFLALNYRMSELSGAVAVAQLEKLEDIVDRRRAMAERLDEALAGLPGSSSRSRCRRATHVYWKYASSSTPSVIPAGPVGLANALKEYSIASAPRYIQKPAFECAVIRDQRTFGSSRFPFTLARPEARRLRPEPIPRHVRGARPGARPAAGTRSYREQHVDYIARCAAHASTQLSLKA